MNKEWYFSWLASFLTHILLAILLSVIVLPKQKLESISLIEIHLLKEKKASVKPSSKKTIVRKIPVRKPKLRITPAVSEYPKRKLSPQPHAKLETKGKSPVLEVKEKVLSGEKPKEVSKVGVESLYPSKSKDKPKLLEVDEKVEGEVGVPLPLGPEEGKGEGIVEPGGKSPLIKGESLEVVSSPSISGPIKERSCVYGGGFEIPPELTTKLLPRLARYRFWVLPSGTVYKVVIEKPFGISTLDRLAITTLYKWRFVPIEADYKDWGIATFRLELQ
jgi:TonB family protein